MLIVLNLLIWCQLGLRAAIVIGSRTKVVAKMI